MLADLIPSPKGLKLDKEAKVISLGWRLGSTGVAVRSGGLFARLEDFLCRC